MFKRIKYIFSLEWKYARLSFLWNIVESAVSTVVTLIIPFFMKLLVDIVISKDPSCYNKIIIYSSIILLINLLQTGLYMTMVYYRKDYIFISDVKFKEDMYKKALRISPECFEKAETYDIYSRAAAFTLGDIHGAFTALIETIFRFASIFSVSIIMIGYSPIISLIYLLTYIPLFLIKMKFQKKLYEFKINTTVQTRKKNILFDFIHDRNTVAELKIFGGFPFIIQRRNEITKKLSDDYIYLTAKNEMKQSFWSIIPEIVYYVSYALFAIFVTIGRFSYGDFTFLISAMGNYTSSIFSVTLFLTNQQKNIYMIDQMIQFFELPEERQTHPSFDRSFTSLSLHNVSFAYPGQEKNVLKKINLHINRGEKIAIVGYNGSGKTTLVKFLLGMFDTYDGAYFINECNTKKINHHDIYHMYSAGMQDYQKYPFNLKENICISDHQKNDPELFEKAINLSGMNTLSLELPHGYDTYLNKQYDPEGIDLSEGQWHKVILARTIYQDHDIVVFDEPTSSLDPISEYKFIHDMKNILSNKTILMVTHRLSSVIDFDRILVLKDGEIVGDGKHSHLMKTCTVYKEMFETQASHYDDISSTV